MNISAGFAETDISPAYFPIRTYFASADKVIDPISSHAAVFSDGNTVLAFLSLDVVIVEYEYVQRIREKISLTRPIPAANIMVCATHNHACPAVVERPGSEKEEKYLDFMIEQGAKAVIQAYDAMVPVEIGSGSCDERRISFNRRFVRKNGSVISQPKYQIVKDDVLFNEGVIDPEVGVLCVRDLNRKIIGMLVNFACHAVHLMGQLSAGYPGVMCNRLKESYGKDCVCVFLNGACGNVIHRNYEDPNQNDTKEITGGVLAGDVKLIVDKLKFSKQTSLSADSAAINIKYRDFSSLEKNIDNLAPFNVFEVLITKGWYRWTLEKLKEAHSRSNNESAEIQVFKIGDTVFGTAPAEYFAQHALRIKKQSKMAKTFVVSLANGWLGYIPHREAFDRIGGHESTCGIWSKMEPAAGDLIADKILELIDNLNFEHSIRRSGNFQRQKSRKPRV
jgi:hypothetical protein